MILTMKGGGPMSNVNYAICKVLVRPLLQGVQIQL